MCSFSSSTLDTCSLHLSREHLTFEISSSVSVLGSFSRISFTDFAVLVIVPRWPDVVLFKASAISNLIILLFPRLNFQVSKFLGNRGTKCCCLKSCFYEMLELNLIMTRHFLFSEKSRTNLTLEIKWESVNKRGRKSTVQTCSYVISCVEFWLVDSKVSITNENVQKASTCVNV